MDKRERGRIYIYKKEEQNTIEILILRPSIQGPEAGWNTIQFHVTLMQTNRFKGFLIGLGPKNTTKPRSSRTREQRNQFLSWFEWSWLKSHCIFFFVRIELTKHKKKLYISVSICFYVRCYLVICMHLHISPLSSLPIDETNRPYIICDKKKSITLIHYMKERKKKKKKVQILHISLR